MNGENKSKAFYEFCHGTKLPKVLLTNIGDEGKISVQREVYIPEEFRNLSKTSMENVHDSTHLVLINAKPELLVDKFSIPSLVELPASNTKSAEISRMS